MFFYFYLSAIKTIKMLLLLPIFLKLNNSESVKIWVLPLIGTPISGDSVKLGLKNCTFCYPFHA